MPPRHAQTERQRFTFPQFPLSRKLTRTDVESLDSSTGWPAGVLLPVAAGAGRTREHCGELADRSGVLLPSTRPQPQSGAVCDGEGDVHLTSV